MSINVKDTGKGIPEADLPHIFDKFYRADADGVAGVGLGLHLAQHIVVQLDGEISVESKQDLGTTFNVRLPRWIEAVGVEESEEKDAKALVGS